MQANHLIFAVGSVVVGILGVAYIRYSKPFTETKISEVVGRPRLNWVVGSYVAGDKLWTADASFHKRIGLTSQQSHDLMEGRAIVVDDILFDKLIREQTPFISSYKEQKGVCLMFPVIWRKSDHEKLYKEYYLK